MIVDLFRGPGGWSTGLRLLGRTDEYGIDNDPAAHATATAAGHAGVCADITSLDPRDHDDVEGVINSSPCPGFSPAGKGEGRKDLALLKEAAHSLHRGDNPATVFGMVRAWQHDERSALALEPLHWVLVTRPKWIASEQVTTVLPLWQTYAEILAAEGYHTWTGLLYAEQYGVPQTRTRSALLAHRDLPVGRPTPIHSRYHASNPRKLDPGMPRWVSMAEALGWDEPELVMRSNYGTGGNTAVRGLRTTDQPAPTVTGKIDRNKWLFAGAGRTSQFTAGQRPRPRPTTLPAHTITGKATATWIKPAEPGAQVSIEEASVLQSFPADYPWQGRRGQQYQQIGNAVPPLMAAHILNALGVGTLPTAQPQLATA